MLRGVQPDEPEDAGTEALPRGCRLRQRQDVAIQRRVAFDSPKKSDLVLARKLEAAMSATLDRSFWTLVRSTSQLQALVDADPAFAAFGIPAGMKKVVTFLREPIDTTLEFPLEKDGARIWRCRDWKSSPPTRHNPATRVHGPAGELSAAQSPRAHLGHGQEMRGRLTRAPTIRSMKTKTLPVALVQERNHGDAAANLAVIEARVAKAAKSGARLVLLPRNCTTAPYFCQHESVDEFDLAEPIPGPSTERLGKLAKQHGVVLVSSLREARHRPVPQHRGGVRRRRFDRRQVPQDAHPRRPGLLREVLFHPRRPRFHSDRYFGRPPRRAGVLGPVMHPEGARLMALAGAELLLSTAIGWDPNDAQGRRSA